jgi:hypothetical protein
LSLELLEDRRLLSGVSSLLESPLIALPPEPTPTGSAELLADLKDNGGSNGSGNAFGWDKHDHVGEELATQVHGLQRGWHPGGHRSHPGKDATALDQGEGGTASVSRLAAEVQAALTLLAREGGLVTGPGPFLSPEGGLAVGTGSANLAGTAWSDPVPGGAYFGLARDALRRGQATAEGLELLGALGSEPRPESPHRALQAEYLLAEATALAPPSGVDWQRLVNHATAPVEGLALGAAALPESDREPGQPGARETGTDAAEAAFCAYFSGPVTGPAGGESLSAEPVEDAGLPLGSWFPQGAGLLTDCALADLAALDQAMRQFLDPVQGLGGGLAGWLAQAGMTPWMMGVAVAATAYELARRHKRRPRLRLALGSSAEDATLTWCPGLAPLSECV